MRTAGARAIGFAGGKAQRTSPPVWRRHYYRLHLRTSAGRPEAHAFRAGVLTPAGNSGNGRGFPLAHNCLDPARKPRAILKFPFRRGKITCNFILAQSTHALFQGRDP